MVCGPRFVTRLEAGAVSIINKPQGTYAWQRLAFTLETSSSGRRETSFTSAKHFPQVSSYLDNPFQQAFKMLSIPEC
jgi:hypothetical protein